MARNDWGFRVQDEEDELFAHLEENMGTCTVMCSNSFADQTNNLDSYISDAIARFDAWSASETEQMDQWISDCEDAWQWILKSYCLDNGNDGEECDFGEGSDPQVPIEEHDGVIGYR